MDKTGLKLAERWRCTPISKSARIFQTLKEMGSIEKEDGRGPTRDGQ